MEKTKNEIYERLNKDAATILALSFKVGSMTETGKDMAIIANDILSNVILLSNPETPDDHFADPGKKIATPRELPDGTPINLCGGDK